MGAVGSQDVQVSGDQIPRVGSRQAEEGAVGGARCQAGSIGQQWSMRCEEFVGGCLLGVSEIGRVGRGKEVYDGGGRAEVLVRLLLCGGSTLRYRVVADKVWRRSAMQCNAMQCECCVCGRYKAQVSRWTCHW